MVFAFESEYQFLRATQQRTTSPTNQKADFGRRAANTKWQTLCIECKQSAKVSNIQVIPVSVFFLIFSMLYVGIFREMLPSV